VQRFRGGLVFEAHRLLYHSTLGLRVLKKKKKRFWPPRETRRPAAGASTAARSTVPTVRDWYVIAEQPAPAPHLARPEGRAARTHMCELLCSVSAALASFSTVTSAGRGIINCLTFDLLEEAVSYERGTPVTGVVSYERGTPVTEAVSYERGTPVTGSSTAARSTCLW